MTVESKNSEPNASELGEHYFQEATRKILSDSRVLIERNPNSYKAQNRVYRVLLNNNQSYVIKFFIQKGLSSVLKEVQCINLLRQASDLIPVPTVVNTGVHGGLWYCILQVMGDMDASQQGIIVSNKAELAQQIGECCGLIHNISQDLSATTIPTHNDWNMVMQDEYNEYVASIERKAVLSEAKIKRLDSIFQKSSKFFRIDQSPRFIHDDLCAANVRLVCRGNGAFQLAGIIDFELVRWGDPLRDLTEIQWTLNRLTLSFDDFLSRYTIYINLPENFKQRHICYGILSRLKHLAMTDDYPRFHRNGDIIRTAHEEINYYLNLLEGAGLRSADRRGAG